VKRSCLAWVQVVAISNLVVLTNFPTISRHISPVDRCLDLFAGRAGARAGVVEIEPALAVVAEVGEKSLIC
jgi:hypothetical protein